MRTQRHMRWHVFTCLVVLVVAPCLSVSPPEFALLCLAAAPVLVAELLNTAIEAVVDLVSPQAHPLAGAAKDVAAGAVLIAAFSAVAVGWLVLFPKLQPIFDGGLQRVSEAPLVVVPALALVVLVSIISLKAYTGTGRPLHGGFPSGHAAVSFALATYLALYSRDALIAVLAVILAAMVSHSRLLLKIHRLFEVITGALLGICLAVLAFWLFS